MSEQEISDKKEIKNLKEKVAALMQSIFELKRWQLYYSMTGAIATLIGGIFLVYNHLYGDKSSKSESSNQPNIIINMPQQQPAQQASVQPVQTAEKQVEVKEKIVYVEKKERSSQPKVQENKEEITVEEKKEEPVVKDPFGIVKNTKKGTSTTTSTSPAVTKNIKQVFVGAYVIGDYTMSSGTSIKVRLSEDLEIEKSILNQSAIIVGTMIVSGNRAYIEFKDNKTFPYSLYATDKDKNLGLPFQPKLGDGFKFLLSNKN